MADKSLNILIPGAMLILVPWFPHIYHCGEHFCVSYSEYVPLIIAGGLAQWSAVSDEGYSNYTGACHFFFWWTLSHPNTQTP